MLRAAAIIDALLRRTDGIFHSALAGPPYLTDDPEPTVKALREIHVLTRHGDARGVAGEGGIDFNYGGAPNLQLTATAPAAYEFPTPDRRRPGLATSSLRQNTAS